MNLHRVGTLIKLVAAGCLGLWLLRGGSWFYPIVIFAVGQIITNRASSTNVVRKPPVPANFTPTYWHSDIAMDTNSGQLWLRDGRRARVFYKKDILGWRVECDTHQGLPAMYGNGVIHPGSRVKMNSRLAIQTSDMDMPTWNVRFRSRGFWFASEANHHDATTWGGRLTAFLST